MTNYVLRRLAVLVGTLVASSLFVFGVPSLLGGSPAAAMLGNNATPAAVAALQSKLGLDAPLWRQYINWVSGLFTGHLGVSIVTSLPVKEVLIQGMQVTFPLTVYSLLVAVMVGVPLGVVAAMRDKRASGVAITGFTAVGIAIPAFWLGILLAIEIGDHLRLLPAGGFVQWQTNVWGAIKSLTLAAVTLGLVQGCALARYVRAACLDVLHEDFLRTARAKGMTRARAMRTHGLRHAAASVVTVLGLHFGVLLGGAVVLEATFNLPGLGQFLINAVDEDDFVFIRSAAIVLIAAVLIVNFASDLIVGWLDPRVRESA